MNSESKDVRAAIEEEKFPSPKAPITTFFLLKLRTLSIFDLKNGQIIGGSNFGRYRHPVKSGKQENHIIEYLNMMDN